MKYQVWIRAVDEAWIQYKTDSLEKARVESGRWNTALKALGCYAFIKRG